jgi:hypothetical protein
MQRNRQRGDAEKQAKGSKQILLDGDVIQWVSRVVYLGSLLTSDGSWLEDLEHRYGIACGKFSTLKPILCSKSLSIRVRIRIFVIVISTTLLYGSECWYGKVNEVLGELKKLTMKFSLKMLASRRDLPCIEAVKKLASDIDLPGLALRRKLNWYRELICSSGDSQSREIALGDPAFFELWCFGEDREAILSRAEDEESWDEWVDSVVLQHGMKKGGEAKISAVGNYVVGPGLE